jgi:hypothetical protein
MADFDSASLSEHERAFLKALNERGDVVEALEKGRG